MRILLFCLMIFFSCLQPAFAQTAAGQKYEKLLVQLGEISGKSATVDELTAHPELVVVVPGSPEADDSIRVSSFKVAVLHAGIFEDLVADNSVTGNRLLPGQIKSLSSLKPGDKVFFDDIRAIRADGTKRSLGSLQLLVR